MGIPPTGTNAFGIRSVKGFSRVPNPAANIMAFIFVFSPQIKRLFPVFLLLKFISDILFPVNYFYVHSEFLSTSEADAEMSKSSFQKTLHMGIC